MTTIIEEEGGHDLELLKKVATQITKDAQDNDYTCLDELLKDIPINVLKGFLPKEGYDE